MKNSAFGGVVLKIFTYLLGIASLTTLGLGIAHQDWYAGFGLVMTMTSLICMVAAHLGVTANSENPHTSVPAPKENFAESLSA